MAEREDVPYIVVERSSGGLGMFLWGALIGAGVALLYAPRSGRETRADIAAGAERIRRRAEDSVRTVQRSVTDTFEGIRTEVNDRIDSARDAIEAGRTAARETRQELEARYRASRDALRVSQESRRARGVAGAEVSTRVEVDGIE